MKATHARNIFFALTAVIIAMGVVSSCKNSKYRRVFTRPDTLCVDSASFCRSDSSNGRCIAVDIHAEYPSPITGKLSANIAAWVRGKLGKGTPADTMSVASVVSYYGNTRYNSYIAGSDSAPHSLYKADCRIDGNRKNYISLNFTLAECAQGAHCITSVSGITFRKSDGMPFGWNMIKDTTAKNFRNLMREGVRSYIRKTLGENNVSDENFRSLLASEPEPDPASGNLLKHFPIPETAPYLSQGGMTFVFQPYEIAPLSLGAPKFTIPFRDIEQHMTKEALTLLKKRN